MKKLGVAAIAALLALPAAPVMAATGASETLYDEALNQIRDFFGFVPPTALVNGKVVPTEDALALLKEFDLNYDKNLYAWDNDIGIGTRAGGFGCLVAAVVTAFASAVTSNPPPPGFQLPEALENEEANGVPWGSIACGAGFPYVAGEVGAEVADTAQFSFACIGQTGGVGGWMVTEQSCHVGDFSAANIVGLAGLVDIQLSFCFFFTCFHFRIEQLFGGVHNRNAAQGLPNLFVGDRDAAVIGLQA